jgi:hypothetical protein
LLNKFVDGVPYLCRSTDISEAGIYLGELIEPHEHRRMLSRDEPPVVGLQFQLPGTEEVIYAEGEVIRYQERKRTGGYGVRFIHLTARHRTLINRYIRDQLSS